MHILFFNPPGFNPNKGGTERVIEMLSHHFRDAGHQLFYLSLRDNQDSTDKEVTGEYLILSHQPRGSRHAARIRYVVDFIRKQKIDLIIDNCHNNKFNHINIIKVAKQQTGVKVVTLYHTSPHAYELAWKCRAESTSSDFYATSKGLKTWLRSSIYRTMGWFTRQVTAKALRIRLQNFDKLILLSDAYIPEVMAMTGITDQSKYAVIPNLSGLAKGVISKNINDKKENIILFVGRLTRIKHPEKAIEIWSRLEADFPDWKMQILGEGELLTALKEWKATKVKRCELLGYQDPLPFYTKAKIIIQTSDYEGLSLVLIEAQRYGVVPIAFRSFGALDDITLQGKAGVAVTPYNLEEFTNKLRELMANKPHWYALSDSARKHSDRYSDAAIMPLWSHLFQELGL